MKMSQIHLRAFLALGLSAMPNLAHAATPIWSGTTDSNWNVGGAGGNWTNAAAPVANDSLTFTGTTNVLTNNNLTANTTFAGTNAITFDNSATSGAFTLAGNQITLGGNILTTGTTGTPTHTISLGMILNGDRTITTGANNNLTVSGIISSSGTRSLTKAGAGVLTLSGSNSYTGATTVNDGTLILGANEVLPNTSAITINKGILEVNGKTETVASLALGAAATTVAGNTATVQDTATGGSLVTGNVTYNAGSVGFLNGQATIAANLNFGASARTITTNDGAAADDLVISGAIINGAAINFSNPGTVVLSNSANNYTTTTIGGAAAAAGGTLKLGANSVLGTGFLSIDQRAAATGTLDINGKNDTITGTLNLGGSQGVAGSATQIIDSAGGGLLSLADNVNTNAGLLSRNGQATISANLNLGATTRTFNIADSTATATDMVISGAIQSAGAGLTKTGAGTLVLSGTNTYTGATTITTGIVDFANKAAKTAATATAGAAGSVGLGVKAADAAYYSATDVGNLFNTNTLTGFSLNAASGVAIDTTNAGADFDQTVALTAGRALTKLGTGTLMLSGANTYTGATTIGAGTLTVSGTGQLGGGSYAGAIANSGNFNYASTANQTLSGIISGTGALTKNGSGTLTLTGANTYTGTTTINAGTVKVTGAGTLGANAAPVTLADVAGATLDFTGLTGDKLIGALSGGGSNGGNIVLAGNTVFFGTGATGNFTYGGIVSGTGAFSYSGTGTQTLSGMNTYSGNTAISKGTLSINSISSINGGASSLGNATSAADGRLDIGGGTDTGTLLYTGSGHTTDRSVNLSGSTGGATLDASGSGALVFTTAFQATTAGAKTLTLTGNNTADNRIDGAIVNSSSGATSLTKSGTGTWALSGTNTYTGATNVTAGELLINGSTSSTSLVTIASDATLGGTGTVGGATTISGTHNPGNSPGIQTFGSNLTYSSVLPSPVVNWELTGNTSTNAANPNAIFDQIIVGGNLDFTHLTLLNLSFNAAGSNVLWADTFWDASQSWTLYDVAGNTSNFDNLNLNTINWLDSGGNLFSDTDSNFSLSQSGQDVILNYTFVPEPNVSALLGGLGMLVLLRRRRA